MKRLQTMMKRTLMTTGLASTMALAATAQNASATAMNNPLLQKSKLTFGAPDFNRIQEGDYLPALKEGIRQQRKEIQYMVNSVPPLPTRCWLMSNVAKP